MCFGLTSAIKKTCLLVEIQLKATWLQQPQFRTQLFRKRFYFSERQFTVSLPYQNPFLLEVVMPWRERCQSRGFKFSSMFRECNRSGTFFSLCTCIL